MPFVIFLKEHALFGANLLSKFATWKIKLCDDVAVQSSCAP